MPCSLCCFCVRQSLFHELVVAVMVAKCRFSHSVCPSIFVGLLLRGMPFVHPIHHSFLPLQQHGADSASSILRALCAGSYPRLWLRRLRLWVAPCGSRVAHTLFLAVWHDRM